MNQILELKEESSGFQTEIEVLAPTALPEDLEAQYQTYQAQIDALAPEIERLTSHADGIDYALAVTCDLVTGVVDTLWSGAEWDFKGAKAWSNRSVNEMVQTFAKKDPGFATFCEYTEKGNFRTKPKDGNRLDKAARGFDRPAPRDYPGSRPLDQRETAALAAYTACVRPDLLLAYHTQGRVIYPGNAETEPPGAGALAAKFSEASGYAVEQVPPESANAGYKDWFLARFHRPGYTIEAGLGENPISISQLPRLLLENEPLLAAALGQ